MFGTGLGQEPPPRGSFRWKNRVLGEVYIPSMAVLDGDADADVTTAGVGTFRRSQRPSG
jgi:hypothetical protein